ncbi:hypothetical protein AAVH_41564, partial [Aphelenchoides avenae]
PRNCSKEVVSSASWTQGLTDGTLQITLLPYAATAQPSKGPFTKLADVTTAIDQAFAGLVPLKDGEVLSQRSAVDAYMMASSADRYPSADSFLLLAPSNLAVYLPIDDARKDFAATGKQLNAIAKVVGKVGVGGVTLSSGLIAGYGLDANVASFAKATADPIVKEFAPTPTSTGGDGGGPTGGKPGGGGPTGGKPGGGDPLGGKNPPGEGVPPVRQPDPDLCYWDQ